MTENAAESNDGPPMCPECHAGQRLCPKWGFTYRKTAVIHGVAGARVQKYMCTKCGHCFTELQVKKEPKVEDGTP